MKTVVDDIRYTRLQDQQFKHWEGLCIRCGACCGIVEGDPCVHLSKTEEGVYFCDIYKSRFGMHKTISGKVVQCVPIRKIIHKSWPGDSMCAYKKEANKCKLF